MTTFVELHSAAHASTRIDQKMAQASLATQHLIPVVISEFLKLCIHFPIVISKRTDTGQFTCSALMGLDSGENLFLGQDEWAGVYLPANIARQPFVLGKKSSSAIAGSAAGDGGEKGLDKEVESYAVCFDMDHPSVNSAQGQALFVNGKDSSCLQQIKANLAELINSEADTNIFLACLADLSLLTPLQLDITGADGKCHKITGLYTVDERKLSALESVVLMKLQQAGYLALIYTMLASHGQIYTLVQKKNLAQGRVAA